MDKPLTVWYCDSCQERIPDPKCGILTWRTERQAGNQVHDFRITHKDDCDPQRRDGHRRSWWPLEKLSGPYASAFLMQFIDTPKPYACPSGLRVRDVPQWAEVYRRLTVLHFEEARRHFARAAADGAFADENEFSIFLPETLQEVIRRYSEDEPSPADRRRARARAGSFKAVAEEKWPDAEWITGEGPYASLAHCGVLTVMLFKTRDEAERAKAQIDKTRCGGSCQGRGGHEIVELSLPE